VVARTQERVDIRILALAADFSPDQMRRIGLALVAICCVGILFIGLSILFFDPKSRPPLEAVSAPFASVDFSRLVPAQRYAARDGVQLAYRRYPVERPRKLVILVHGSSGSSRGMHALAESLLAAGFSVYALDMRGHGESGEKGDIHYVGQLEDDIEDFVTGVLHGNHTAALVGFSSGGGFVLRFAGSPRQRLFAQYVLLSPYLRHDAPTTKPANGDWAATSVPRIVTLSILGRPGEAWFGNLPVVRFAVDPKSTQYQTPFYSFRLWRNFKPHDDFAADIKAASQRLDVMVGEKDELLFATEFEPLFKALRPATTVTLVPGVGHITLTTSPDAGQALARLLGS
jgi:alpha-beta hydrolase superfamily lysophospholipase